MLVKVSAFMACLIFVFAAISCSGGSVNPVTPQATTQLSAASDLSGTGSSHKYLWGYYDVFIDVENETITVSPDRTVANTINAVNFFNKHPEALSTGNLQISLSNPPGAYVDADIDITIMHPFPGLTQFNGYDVCLVFIGNASRNLEYNPELRYAFPGMDQIWMDDPLHGDGGGPDGYTRWFNPPEFNAGGLLGYVPGKIASQNYTGNATLNPYTLFASGIGSHQDSFEFIRDELGNGNNVMEASGVSVTRNMFLRFFVPSPGIKYNYAIMANWENKETHPANAVEVMAASVAQTDGLYYVNQSTNGGHLILDISLAGYGYQPSAIIVESTVFSNPYTLNTSEMVPVSENDTWATYHVDIPDADNVNGLEGNEGWIIAEYGCADYTNEFNAQNLAWEDPLASFFRFPIAVGTEFQGNQDPICDIAVVTPMPANGIAPVTVEFDASGSYDPDGSIVKYEWNFDGVGYLDLGLNANPTHDYWTSYSGDVWVRITDDEGATSECSVSITVNIGSNQAPVADIDVVTPMPVVGPAVLNVEFDASGSYDPDGIISKYEYNFDGTGYIDLGYNNNPTHQYSSTYIGNVFLRVTDNLGGTSVDAVYVQVIINSPPVCNVVVTTPLPLSGLGYVPVELDGTGSYDNDPGDSVVGYSWDFNGDNIFGDPYNAGTDSNPVKYFGSNYSGYVNVKIVDSYGSTSTCNVWIDVTVLPSKNIIIKSGLTPLDLAVDHADGDLLVLFDNGDVYRYTKSGNYVDGSLFYSSNPNYKFIDIAPDSTSMCGTAGSIGNFSPTGTLISTTTLLASWPIFDLMGGTATIHYNKHMFIGFNGSLSTSLPRIFTFSPPTYSSAYWQFTWHRGPQGPGNGQLSFDNLVAAECSKDPVANIYTLETNDYRVEVHTITEVSTWMGNNWSFSGISWGGMHSEGMDGFWNPLDITRDLNSYFYILDQMMNNAPVIKKYNSTGTPIGFFGNSSTISGTPLRIEGSDYNGNIFVLHESPAGDALLSIFVPVDMP